MTPLFISLCSYMAAAVVFVGLRIAVAALHLHMPYFGGFPAIFLSPVIVFEVNEVFPPLWKVED